MNNDDSDLLFEITEQFYMDFSDLVNKTLEKAPDHLREDLKIRLQEKTSVYGVMDNEGP